MTYREFIESLSPSGCRVKLNDGTVISLQTWHDHLKAFEAIDIQMSDCEVTLVWESQRPN